MATQHSKGEVFARLHNTGTFVIPNFWDIGSARILQNLGFQALASTSSGLARSMGRQDGEVSLEEKLDHLRDVSAATNVPISADFEQGFADAPEQVAANLLRAAEAGVVGASIEDWSGQSIYDLSLAVERIQAGAEALAGLVFPFTLTARAENLLRGNHSFDDTIARLQAYAAAGADVVYAPGLSSSEQIETILSSVSKPLNVLCTFIPDLNFSGYDELGVRRISTGGALANQAINATLTTANRMLEQGDFTWVLDNPPAPVIKSLLSGS